MYKDLGTHMNGVVLGDASEAFAIVARRRMGKLWHPDTNYLWVQEEAAKGDLRFKKVAGVESGADFFTKTLPWTEIQSPVCPEKDQCEQRRCSAKGSQSSSNTARKGSCPRQKTGSMDSNRHELSNETHNYERWTCME